MTELKATIISGFPGVGKSYAIDSLTMKGFKVSEYQEDDPSEFAIVKPHTITITKTIYK